MANVSYIALRNISSGHTSGVTYNFDFDITDDGEQYVPDNVVKRAIDGTIVTVNRKTDLTYAISTEYVLRGSSSWDLWIEFLNSVGYGESFDLDPYGTDASPSTGFPLTVKLDGGFRLNRVDAVGNYTISFSVIYNENF